VEETLRLSSCALPGRFLSLWCLRISVSCLSFGRPACPCSPYHRSSRLPALMDLALRINVPADGFPDLLRCLLFRERLKWCCGNFQISLFDLYFCSTRSSEFGLQIPHFPFSSRLGHVPRGTPWSFSFQSPSSVTYVNSPSLHPLFR